MNNRSSNNYLRGFSKIKKLYISIMLLYELADKLFGSIYIAFMRSKGLTLIQISRLFSIEQIFPRIQASARFFSIIALISSYIFINIADMLILSRYPI